MPRKPNLIIAGAQKSGTSWLHAKLRQHPDVFMPAHKELGYFNRMDFFSESEYLTHFEDAKNEVYVGEATPHYFWHKTDGWPFCDQPVSNDVASEMHRFLGPSLRLVFSLRDPVSRAVSAWHHNICMGRNSQFKGIFDCAPSMGLVDLGFYQKHWNHFERFFGRNHMHVVLYDDLKKSPKDYLSWVLHLLDLKADDSFYEKLNLEEKINTRDHLKIRLPDETDLPRANPQEIGALLEIYKPHIHFVERITGRSLPEWQNLEVLLDEHC